MEVEIDARTEAVWKAISEGEEIRRWLQRSDVDFLVDEVLRVGDEFSRGLPDPVTQAEGKA